MVNFTFVSQKVNDGRLCRVSSRTACESCRSKKRRCSHQTAGRTPPLTQPARNAHRHKRARTGHAGTDKHPSDGAPACEEVTAYVAEGQDFDSQQHQDEIDSLPISQHLQDREAQEIESDPTPQFVGDLNPVARLLDEKESRTEYHANSPYEVGVWIQPKPGSSISLGTNTSYLTPSIIQNPQERQQQLAISDIVATRHVIALSNLYFANIHPILPLLSELEYRNSLVQQRSPAALVHAVCLIAAKDKAAVPHLRLLESAEVAVPVRAFCAKLHASVTASIGCLSSTRRIILIRVLGLLSLHQEGLNGAEQASGHLAMACHHAQTLAIHLNRPGHTDNLEMKKTFWCLWTLDRLNAATNSRPCIFHDVDIAIDRPQPGELGSAAFDIWFHIAQTLSHAIALYRPTNPDTITGIEVDYTGFEQLVNRMQGWHLSYPTLATLRIFFLATAVVAYRLKMIKTLPKMTAARLRQQFSAMQIVRQTQDKDRLESLHPLPVIIYGVSLALSVSYQQLRYSRLAMEQEEALQDFKTACKTLQILQERWSSADTMASLAQKVLIELERVPSLSLLHVDEQRPGSQRGHGTCDNDNAERLREDYRNHHDTVSLPPSDNSNPERLQTNQMVDLPRSEDHHEFAWNAEAHDLFEGMDDISWAFLGAENSFRLDNLSDLDLNM